MRVGVLIFPAPLTETTDADQDNAYMISSLNAMAERNALTAVTKQTVTPSSAPRIEPINVVRGNVCTILIMNAMATETVKTEVMRIIVIQLVPVQAVATSVAVQVSVSGMDIGATEGYTVLTEATRPIAKTPLVPKTVLFSAVQENVCPNMIFVTDALTAEMAVMKRTVTTKNATVTECFVGLVSASTSGAGVMDIQTAWTAATTRSATNSRVQPFVPSTVAPENADAHTTSVTALCSAVTEVMNPTVLTSRAQIIDPSNVVREYASPSTRYATELTTAETEVMRSTAKTSSVLLR